MTPGLNSTLLLGAWINSGGLNTLRYRSGLKTLKLEKR